MPPGARGRRGLFLAPHHLVVHALRLGAFRDYDDTEVLVPALPLLDALDHFFDGEGHLGDEDVVSPPGDAGDEGYPAGVTPHNFQYHDAVVGRGSGVQFVQGVAGHGHGGVEADGIFGARQIVVDGLGDAHAPYPVPGQAVGHGVGVIAADGDDGVDAVLAQVDHDVLHPALHVEGVGAGSPQDGPAPLDDAGDGSYEQRLHLVLYQAAPAALDADDLITFGDTSYGPLPGWRR